MAVDPHLRRLLDDLSRPEALPVPAARVEVVQTHASVVFLTEADVFKVRKPVDLGFLDYRTPERRRRFAELEVAINTPLAPGVYHGVLPVTEGPDGRLRLGGEGEPVDWAVHMTRLPDEATLRHRVRTEPGDLATARRVGAFVGAFHRDAPRPPEARQHADFEAVAGLARDNLVALRPHAALLGPDVARLEQLTESALASLERLIRARVPRASVLHGDLRAEHVYLLPDGAEPRIVVLDAVEFSEALRHGDPMADVGFLAMDLQAYGGWHMADAFVAGWREVTGDDEGLALLPFHIAYRSAVRAKVALLQASALEVPSEARAAALERARRHLRLAVGTLMPPRERPRLVITSGLPGSGKSVLARTLADVLPAVVIRTDVVRKALAGLGPLDRGGPELYAPEHTERTYARCLELAGEAIAAGRPAVVDGNFPTAARRAEARALAVRLGVPFHVLWCRAPDHVLRERVVQRRRDPSDADAHVLDKLRARFEPPEGVDVVEVDTTRETVGQRLLEALGIP